MPLKPEPTIQPDYSQPQLETTPEFSRRPIDFSFKKSNNAKQRPPGTYLVDLLNKEEEERTHTFMNSGSQGRSSQALAKVAVQTSLVQECVDFEKVVESVVKHYGYNPIVMQFDSG